MDLFHEHRSSVLGLSQYMNKQHIAIWLESILHRDINIHLTEVLGWQLLTQTAGSLRDHAK
jgi:hypothetical protein